MIGYMSEFLLFDTDEILKNSRNQRQDLLAERITKGPILSNKGKVLAKTEKNTLGQEERVYPYNGLFSHVVGRVENGKTGLELSENYTMLTSNINPIIGMANDIKGVKNPGNQVVTTLDVGLQKVASESMGNHKGAVVAIEPETGKILVMLSKPTYNPNLISSEWEKLTKDDDEESALYNRASQGLYPPGSTFKLITALEYMRENDKTSKFRYQCKGSIGNEGDRIRCFNGKVHGNVTFESAFAKSCNTAFSKMGMKLDVLQWSSLCNSLYFNKMIPFSLEQKKSSFVLKKTDPEGIVRQTAIGQGDTLVTPLQNSLLVMAACNGGKIMKPYVVDRIEDSEGTTINETSQELLSSPINEKEASELTKLMKATVSYGTATRLISSNYQAGGKTGSAEYKLGSNESHAWFVGFAKKKKKKIVVSIIIEGAGIGGEVAVPIARKIFDAW